MKGKGRAKEEEEKDKECVKKFVGMNAENALKTKPRDYDADHKDILLLRLRNFTIGRRLKDEEVVGKGGLERIIELMGCLVPFVSFPSAVITAIHTYIIGESSPYISFSRHQPGLPLEKAAH